MSPDQYAPVDVQESSTSYFSQPSEGLDPSLFDGEHLRPHVRDWIIDTVHDFLDDHFLGSRLWARIWIAGSGVSYQWSADRDPADLDLMLGIDYVPFRQYNQTYAGMSDAEIARDINVLMYSQLYPDIDGVSFGGTNFEVTVYANLGVHAGDDGVKFIHPYAAYDVTGDQWTVRPERHPRVSVHPSWNITVESDRVRGEKIVRSYGDALRQVRGAQNPAHRVNAERTLNLTLEAARGLYDEIHAGRKAAFGPAGHGYADFHNYRWQAGKSTGVVQAMKRMKDYKDAAEKSAEVETYGMELPDHETLIRRAGTYYGNV